MTDDPSRRDLLRTGAVLGGAAVAGAGLLAAARSAGAQPPPHDHDQHQQHQPSPPGPRRPPRPRPARPDGARVVTPNGSTLPWKTVGGVKILHLVAEPVRHVFAPGLEAECWGYNGGTPG